MITTRGEMDEKDLRREAESEDVPCGKCVTTSYYALDNGEMVRRDIAVEIDSGKVAGLAALDGRVN